MYVRQPPDGRFVRSVRVPQNYSGNAFREGEERREEPLPVSQEEPQDREEAAPTARHASLPTLGFRLGAGHLLRRDGGFFGVEELLILGLILLVASGDSSDEVILLLLLLLFIE